METNKHKQDAARDRHKYAVEKQHIATTSNNTNTKQTHRGNYEEALIFRTKIGTVLSLRGQSIRGVMPAKVKYLSASSLSPETPLPDVGQLPWRKLDLNTWLDLSEEHGSVLAASEHCMTALHERDFGNV